MKSLSTILIAIILFGLCLIEKELKSRAMDSQMTRAGLTKNRLKNPSVHQNVKATLVQLNRNEAKMKPSHQDLDDWVKGDSTIHVAVSSLDKPL